MRIVIYDVAADSGGALTVLKDYHERALRDKDNEYLFIVSLPHLPEADNVAVYREPTIKRSWISRIHFDLFNAHKLIREYGAERVLSLQNMRVPFVKKEQIVYMHNLLPRQICDLRFSLAEEPKMWLYQHVIGRLMLRSLRRADGIIVQTKWLKRRLIERCGIQNDRIEVDRPTVRLFVSNSARKPSRNPFIFFYPASGMPFKNHDVIITACEILESKGFSGFKIVFTLNGNENDHIVDLKRRALALPVEFCGWLDKAELVEMYQETGCLLFPSRLETWGLPLAEAASLTIPIIASDLEYAHETLRGVPDVAYCNPLDPSSWADRMADIMDSRRFQEQYVNQQ